MRLALIAAVARNGAIGRDNQLLVRLPDDLRHFRDVTMGAPVIMGRKTWDSVPARFRPLPGRRNIVVTRQINLNQTGIETASSLREALQLCENAEQVWIIGGAQIYAQALPLADELVVTEIDANVEGDAHAPAIGPEWQEVAREALVAGNGMRLAFVTWRHKPR